MTRTQYNEARDAAHAKGFTATHLTGNANGYPEPFLGYFIHGFDTLEEAKDFANENGGEVYHATWRDGWNTATLNGPAFEEYTPSSDDYGDDYRIIEDEAALECEADSLRDCVGPHADEDEKAAMAEAANNLIGSCADVDWNKYAAIICDNQLVDTVAKHSTHFYHDTHHYAIGVWLSNEFDEEEEEN